MSRRIMIILFIAVMLGLASGIAVGRDIKINFQQSGGEVPEGYFPDYGEPFGVRDSGFSYGWSRGIEGDSRDRNSSNAVDQRYDTLLHLQKGADAIWEIELPNGTYDLFMACGDPDNTDQTDTFDVENVIIVDPDGQDNFDEYEVTVVVSDGRLTIKPASGAYNCKIMFVDIMGVVFSQAYSPTPEDGALYKDTWVSVIWKAGDTSASHNVYFSDSFDDVNDGTGDAFRGNQTLTDFTVGFSGLLYPDGLVPGVTYYWRIDEVEADGTTIHKGSVWSFSIPPRTAYSPDPADGAENVELNVKLTWTTGLGAQLNFVYFGDDFDDVYNDTSGTLVGTTTYNPGVLELAKTYYWRVDEFQAPFTHKGDVWSFTTEGAASGPNPAKGAVGVRPNIVLTWNAGRVAASHDVYFGADAATVAGATKDSPEYKGPKTLGEESYDPGQLMLNTAYYWRIDEVNSASTDSPWTGNVWSFTTGNFFVIDDFESYDVGNNEIWWAWKDGLGYVAHGNAPAYPGNGTGAAVGDETTASYAEETIVHDGSQSLPLWYDNNKQGYSNYSEAKLTLSTVRDWTSEGVSELSIWFRGNPVSVGSFVEGPTGTYTITASGSDIFNTADEFHYAFKTLAGAGSIVAKVISVGDTDSWAKAGVMIRETLDAGSKFAAVYITPGNGCRFQIRSGTDGDATSDSSVATAEQMAINAPYWIKLERDVVGNFKGSYSADGVTWRQMFWNPRNIPMSSSVYVGLALTSHNNAATCEAVFSNVTITGMVGNQWANQDIGIISNGAEPLYVAVSNSTGKPVVVVHDDPAAANISTWTEWVIPLSTFADQGINLTNVDGIAIGLGTRGNTTIPGGSGTMYFDDIRLYQSREAAELRKL